MSKPIIVLGRGGHAKVVIDSLLSGSIPVTGIVDRDPVAVGDSIYGVPVIGGDELVFSFPYDEIKLVNGLGSIALPLARTRLFESFAASGYSFANVIHPSAIIASDAELGEGCQIMAGAVIQPGCRLGCNVIINTRVAVDHDCTIGDHVHLAPGVTLSGGVTVSEGVHIGTGATVIQGVHIGSGSLIAAGAVVIHDIPSDSTAIGVPARVVQT